MDSKTAKKISKEIIYNLEIILSNKDLSSHVSDTEFRKNIIKQLSILKQLFTIQKAKESDLFDLIDKFNLFMKDNKISADEIVATDYKEQSEFLDEANYLKVFISNTFSRPFDSYSHNAENIKKLNSLETTAPVVAAVTQDTTSSTNSSTNANSAYNYGAYNQQAGNPYQYGSPEDYKQRIKMDMVNRRILDDFNKGNYYFYTSKPKIIPILKKISAISTIILGLLMLAFMGLQIAVMNLGLNVFIEGKIVPLGNSNSLTLPWMTLTIVVMLAVWIIYNGYKQLLPIKNDNYKYRVNNFGYWMTFIFGMFLVFNVVGMQKTIGLITDPDAGNSAAQINTYKASVYIQYVVIAIFLSNAIYPILNNIYRPQDNMELRHALVEKYSKEIDELGILK